MATLENIPRSEKLDITRKLHQNLITRAANGPPEPALDEYAIELSEIITVLGQHVTGRDTAQAARELRLARVENADIDVDTWYRHIEDFIAVEASRRAGLHVVACKRLYAAACPDGLAHINDRVVDENAYCRKMLFVLRSPEHASLLSAIELPPSWLDRFDTALTESEAAMDAVIAARDDTSTHVDLGQNAEGEWVDLMARFRKYISSRAKRREAEKIAEGKSLLQPLLATLQKLRTDAATRATRKKAAPAAPAAPAPVTAPSSPK